MRLYKVCVEHTFMMVAEDENEAQWISKGCAAEAIKEDLNVDLIYEEVIDKLEEIPKDWLDACPYGEGGNARTCKEWLVG